MTFFVEIVLPITQAVLYFVLLAVWKERALENRKLYEAVTMLDVGGIVEAKNSILLDGLCVGAVLTKAEEDMIRQKLKKLGAGQ